MRPSGTFSDRPLGNSTMHGRKKLKICIILAKTIIKLKMGGIYEILPS